MGIAALARSKDELIGVRSDGFAGKRHQRKMKFPPDKGGLRGVYNALFSVTYFFVRVIPQIVEILLRRPEKRGSPRLDDTVS